MGPSRADTSDSWGAERKFVPGGGDDRYGRRDSGAGGGGFRDRGSFGGGFQDREDRPPREFDDGPSRADTGDWGARQFVPSQSSRRSYDEPRGGGGGFRERESFREPRDSFKERESFREPTRADVEQRWERHNDVKPTGFDDRPRRPFDEAPRERKGFSDGWRGRERDETGPGSRDGSRDQWKKERPIGEDSSEAPRERPKLVLKPRTGSADARPASGDAGRPSIFGAARPREEVLREQGRDPVEEDERLEAAAKVTPKPRKERHTGGGGDEETAAAQAKLAEAQAKAEDSSLTEEERSNAAEEVAALESELAKLKVESDEKTSHRGREGERRGSSGGWENGQGSAERSGSRRREGGGREGRDDRSSFRRRDEPRDGSRGGAGGGAGDRW